MPNDVATGEAAEDQEELDDVDDDDLRRVIVGDTMRKSKGEAEVRSHVRGPQKGLYPNCEDGNTKLGTVLELLHGRQRMLCLTKDLRSY